MFKLPIQTTVNKIVPKSFFDKLLSSAKRRQLTTHVERLRILNKLSQSSTLLIACALTEIQIMEVELKDKTRILSLIEEIDRHIPYYIIYVLRYEGMVQVAASIKHLHSTQPDKAVVDCLLASDWFPFPTNVPPITLELKENLDAVYLSLCKQLSHFPAHTGTLPQLLEKELKYKRLSSEIEKLESKMKNCPQFNKKVDLNSELREKNQERNELLNF